MKVKVTKETVVITECSCINEGEVCVNDCLFQLPECFDELSVTATFNNIPVPVINGKCNVPSLKKGTVYLGVYAYKENDNGVELMYSPKPTKFSVNAGSYSDEVDVEKIPTISEFEQFCKSYSQEIMKEIGTSGGNFETTGNKITVIDKNATDKHYPSAKAVYDFVGKSNTGLPVVESPKVWELESGCYYASDFVALNSDVGFYVYDNTLLYVGLDKENAGKNHFVLFLGYTNGFPYDVISGTTDGTDSEWYGVESEKNKIEKIDGGSTHDQYPSAKAVYDLFSEYEPSVGTVSGGGLNSTAITLLIQILQEAIYSTNVSGKIEQLQTALAEGSTGGSGGSGDSGDSGGADTPTTTDDITVTDGVMTIISVGSEISVTDSIMTIL